VRVTEAVEAVATGLRFKSSAALTFGTLVPVCLQTVYSMCACINYEQVQMDYVLFIPPPPFFEGTLTEFDTTLEECCYGHVVLLFRVRVKMDKKDGKGRLARMG
jgi:hypothetical protein